MIESGVVVSTTMPDSIFALNFREERLLRWPTYELPAWYRSDRAPIARFMHPTAALSPRLAPLLCPHRVGRRCRGCPPDRAQVERSDLPFGGQQEVRQLHVAANQRVPVGMVEAQGGLTYDPAGGSRGEPTPGSQQPQQVTAVEVLQDEGVLVLGSPALQSRTRWGRPPPSSRRACDTRSSIGHRIWSTCCRGEYLIYCGTYLTGLLFSA